jgi:hypothetical protein
VAPTAPVLVFSIDDGTITSGSSPISFDTTTGIMVISTSTAADAGIYTFNIQVDLSLDSGGLIESETYAISVTIIDGTPAGGSTDVVEETDPENVVDTSESEGMIEEEQEDLEAGTNTLLAPYFIGSEM